MNDAHMPIFYPSLSLMNDTTDQMLGRAYYAHCVMHLSQARGRAETQIFYLVGFKYTGS